MATLRIFFLVCTLFVMCPIGYVSQLTSATDNACATGNSTIDRVGCLDTDGDGWSDPDTNWTTINGADSCKEVAGKSSLDRNGCSDTDNDGWSNPDQNWKAHPDGQGDALPFESTQWEDSDFDGWGDNQSEGAKHIDYWPDDRTAHAPVALVGCEPPQHEARIGEKIGFECQIRNPMQSVELSISIEAVYDANLSGQYPPFTSRLGLAGDAGDKLGINVQGTAISEGLSSIRLLIRTSDGELIREENLHVLVTSHDDSVLDVNADLSEISSHLNDKSRKILLQQSFLGILMIVALGQALGRMRRVQGRRLRARAMYNAISGMGAESGLSDEEAPPSSTDAARDGRIGTPDSSDKEKPSGPADQHISMPKSMESMAGISKDALHKVDGKNTDNVQSDYTPKSSSEPADFEPDIGKEDGDWSPTPAKTSVDDWGPEL